MSDLLTGRRTRGGPMSSKGSQPIVGTNTRRRSSFSQRVTGLKNRIVGAITGNRRQKAVGAKQMHGTTTKRSMFGSRRHHLRADVRT